MCLFFFVLFIVYLLSGCVHSNTFILCSIILVVSVGLLVIFMYLCLLQQNYPRKGRGLFFLSEVLFGFFPIKLLFVLFLILRGILGSWESLNLSVAVSRQHVQEEPLALECQ